MATKVKCPEEWVSGLIDRYDKLIFSICYRITGDYFAAQDLTQETFLAAFRSYREFTEQNEKAWLCRIASNKCIDYLRSAGHRSIPTEEEFFSGLREKARGPEETVLEQEIKAELGRYCSSLKSPYNEIARAHYIEELSAAEIAAKRGSHLKTVQTQIYRARNLLRELYRKEGKT